MLCISINQESRRMALVDMINAGRCGGDVLELRLDRFGKAPDLGELLSVKPKPVVMTCRRAEDGGQWDGTEEERLAILRQCVVSQADYVELELDVADAVRRYGKTKRVVAYTNLRETPDNIVDLYDQARGKSPDVVKLVTAARTPEEAWPLVQILAKASTPTVVVGLGRANAMLALLGRKLGAPWIYAALERGMEAYPGQPTVDDLERVYRVKEIERGTRFVGVLGHGPRETARVACLNAAFAAADMNLRCLPLEIGSSRIFRRLIDLVKLQAVVADDASQARVREMELDAHGTAKRTGHVDVLAPKDDVLHAFHKGAKAWTRRLGEAMAAKYGAAFPYQNRVVLILGLGPATRIVADDVRERGGAVVLASARKAEAAQWAKELECRVIAPEAIYSTMHDAFVVAAPEPDAPELHAGFVKPGQVVADYTAELTPTKFLSEAQARDAAPIAPLDVFLDQTEEIARMLTSRPVDRETLASAIPERFLPE